MPRRRCRSSIVDEAGKVERLRALAIAGSELEMNTHRTHKESIDVVRIGAAEIAAHRDGISLKGPMIWALRQAGADDAGKGDDAGHARLERRPRLCAGGLCERPRLRLDRQRRQCAHHADRRPAAPSCACSSTATALGVALQPHSQTLQEYPEMAGLRAAMHRQTGVADGATLQMFFRLGYAADPGPSPRRALDSFVTA